MSFWYSGTHACLHVGPRSWTHRFCTVKPSHFQNCMANHGPAAPQIPLPLALLAFSLHFCGDETCPNCRDIHSHVKIIDPQGLCTSIVISLSSILIASIFWGGILIHQKIASILQDWYWDVHKKKTILIFLVLETFLGVCCNRLNHRPRA